MATQRKVKRAKAKADAAKAKKNSSNAGNAKAKPVDWNANAKSVAAVITFGVAQETTVATAGVCGLYQRAWAAIGDGVMDPSHAGEMCNAIAKRVAKAKGEKFKPVRASRISETKTILTMASWKCTDNLVANLSKLNLLTFEHLKAIVAWMKGTPKQKAHWKPEYTLAPKVEQMESIIRSLKARASKKPTAHRKVNKNAVVGMPHDIVRGYAHAAKCTKSFIRAHGASLPKNAQQVLAGMMKNFDALVPAVKAAKAAQEKAAAAEALKKSLKN